MKTRLKFKNYFMLTFCLFALSCGNDDGGSITFSAKNLVTNFDENPTIGDVVGTIQATSPATLSFSITSQTPTGALSINAITGELIVANSARFDFETNPVINATVSVIDPDNSEIKNVTINLNDLDAIADFLTTSQAAYTAATAGNWVAITEAEYNSLAGNLSEVSKSAIPDNLFISEEGNLSSGAYGFTLALENGATLIMPNGSYLFGFKYVSKFTGSRTDDQVKQSSTSASSGFIDIGSKLPSHTGVGDYYFVLKGNDISTTATGYLGFYSSEPCGYQILTGMTTNYASGNNNTLGGSNNTDIYVFQGLSTTQVQW